MTLNYGIPDADRKNPGGTSRDPAIRDSIVNVFGHSGGRKCYFSLLRRWLHADRCVVRRISTFFSSSMRGWRVDIFRFIY